MAESQRDDSAPEGFADLGAAWRSEGDESPSFSDVDVARVRASTPRPPGAGH